MNGYRFTSEDFPCNCGETHLARGCAAQWTAQHANALLEEKEKESAVLYRRVEGDHFAALQTWVEFKPNYPKPTTHQAILWNPQEIKK